MGSLEWAVPIHSSPFQTYCAAVRIPASECSQLRSSDVRLDMQQNAPQRPLSGFSCRLNFGGRLSRRHVGRPSLVSLGDIVPVSDDKVGQLVAFKLARVFRKHLAVG